eukprot:203587_1
MGNKFNKKSDDKADTTIASNYFPPNGYPVLQHRLEPIARILLIGVYDDNNPLSIFRGMRYLMKQIWEFTIQFNIHYYSPYIKINTINKDSYSYYTETDTDTAFEALHQWNVGSPCWGSDAFKNLKFPPCQNKEININMMPILMNVSNMDKQLPDELHGYIPLICACLSADPSQMDKICFLTIHESFVEKGKTQRRPGLHCELPGAGIGGNSEWRRKGWGGGYDRKDGIFMGSNISNTCVAWNCKIVDRDDKPDTMVMDSLGSLEHLKCLMPNDQKYLLDGGKLYWMTDRTPHEALPMKQDAWRQFFRLVSSSLGVWYENHSTKNPYGIVVDKKITKIVKGNKFKKKK